MTITVEFDPPQPGDSREAFNNKAFDTVAKFNPWSQQANALALEVNDDAAAAEAGAEIVNAVVNFRGAWDDLTGALSVPASCAHASGYWILLESVADVTAHEPGVSAVWAMYDSDFARLSGADFTGPITVPAGASGDQVPRASEVALLTGAAFTGPITVPAGASGAQAVRASEAQWSGAVTVPMSGTAVDVSGIPLSAQEIAVMFQNVGIPAAAGVLLRIGNPTVSEVDYASISSAVTPAPQVGASLELTGIAVRSGSVNASIVNGGLRILRVGSDNWFDGQFFGNDDFRMITVSGRKAMAGISVIRILLTTGSFSGGNVLVRWRY